MAQEKGVEEVFFSDYLEKKAKKKPCGVRCLGHGRYDSSTRRIATASP